MCVLVLCLGQLKLFQPVFPQVISGQVFPGHQPDHLKIQRETKSEHSIQNILHIVSDQSVRNHAENELKSKNKQKHSPYPVFIIHHHQMSEPQSSEQLEDTRQRRFLQTNHLFLNPFLGSTKS